MTRLEERRAVERWLELRLRENADGSIPDPVATAARLAMLTEISACRHHPAADGDGEDELVEIVRYVRAQAIDVGGESTPQGRELISIGDALHERLHRGG